MNDNASFFCDATVGKYYDFTCSCALICEFQLLANAYNTAFEYEKNLIAIVSE